MISPGKGKVAELKLHRQQNDLSGQSRGRRKGNKLFAVLSVAFVGYLIFSLGNQFHRLSDMQNNVESLQGQLKDLKTRNTALRQEIKQIKSDSYIEQVAREQLGLVKPGENLVVQAQPANNATANPASNPVKDSKKQSGNFNVPYKNIYD